MEPKEQIKHRKKVKHYNIPGHAHELTFSCYHRYPYLVAPEMCSIFLDELSRARDVHNFDLWAYVLMPSHVHLLILPSHSSYKISAILQSLKGRAAKRYGDFLKQSGATQYERFCITVKGKQTFRFWQAGGGFDRNLWNPRAIHAAIYYIENNPVRAGLVDSPEKWRWSSAYARQAGKEPVPDRDSVPMLTK